MSWFGNLGSFWKDQQYSRHQQQMNDLLNSQVDVAYRDYFSGPQTLDKGSKIYSLKSLKEVLDEIEWREANIETFHGNLETCFVPQILSRLKKDFKLDCVVPAKAGSPPTIEYRSGKVSLRFAHGLEDFKSQTSKNKKNWCLRFIEALPEFLEHYITVAVPEYNDYKELERKVNIFLS